MFSNYQLCDPILSSFAVYHDANLHIHVVKQCYIHTYVFAQHYV